MDNSTTACPIIGCFIKNNGHVIFYAAVSVVAALLLLIVTLLIAICCICRRKRNSSTDAEGREETNSGKKGDVFQIVEIQGGETTAEGEKNKSKTNGNERIEDTKLENFAEAMYATVDDQPSSNSQAKQTSNIDQMTDGHNYDIITHVEEDDCARAGKKSSNAPGKSTGKAAKKSKEKKTAPETVVTEYSVPDKAHMQKKQNARKASTNLEQSASGGGVSASLEYTTLLHVTSSNTQQLSMPPPMSSEYSIITQQDGRRNGSMSDINGRQRGRTRSPPEEPPPPLPPPFVDEESPAINTGIQSSALKQQKRNDIGGLYGNASVSVAKEELMLYDDPATSEPQQEMYMNIGKR